MLYNKLNLECAKFASKSEIKPELTGVFFMKDKTVATDSFQLMEITTDKSVKPEDFPKWNNKTAMRGCKPFIAPAKALKDIKIPTGKNVLPICECVAISNLDDKSVEFLTTNLEVGEVKMVKRIDGKFPEYEQIFPQEVAKGEVLVNGEWLAEMAKTLSKFNARNKEIKIKFYGENKPLVLEAGNDEQKGRALLQLIIA